MYRLLALVAVLGLAAPASAATNPDLMDLSEGPWVLTSDAGGSCPLTLGDMPADEGRHLDGGGDCRELDAALSEASGWRIDAPDTLVFIDGTGKALLRMPMLKGDGTFRTKPGREPALILKPAE
jgi:hypothetical protein